MSIEAGCIIKSIRAREILDSRGNPTVEAEVRTSSGIKATASTPSGASTGKHEAIELRDTNDISRFLGRGVLRAVTNVNEKIASIIVGRCCDNQQELDRLMAEADGTENMGILGANATTAVSMACAKAAAKTRGIQLYEHISGLFNCTHNTKTVVTTPVPLMNIVNGGKHAGSELAIQEFMIAPVGARNFSEAVRMGTEIYHELKFILSTRMGKTAVNVGDEGGFAPALIKSAESVFSYISDAVEKRGYSLGRDVVFEIDCAASNFWNPDTEHYAIDGKSLNTGELLDYYCSLCDLYPIRIIEDPFREDDLDSFVQITSRLGGKTCIVGDDIFVSHNARVLEGIELGAANSIIIKINQVGSLTRAIEATRTASSRSWSIVASHRSGETTDDWLADFSVGIGSDGIKSGAPARGERTAKYNRIMQIEQSKSELSLPKMVFKSSGLLK
jgi:enolase